MKNLSKENIIFIIKISFIILFWPFVLIYYFYKKYKKRKEEMEIKKWTEEIKRRYNDFPLKDRFTDEEIIKMIIQDLENDIKLSKLYKIKKDEELAQKVVLFMWN